MSDAHMLLHAELKMKNYRTEGKELPMNALSNYIASIYCSRQ